MITYFYSPLVKITSALAAHRSILRFNFSAACSDFHFSSFGFHTSCFDKHFPCSDDGSPSIKNHFPCSDDASPSIKNHFLCFDNHISSSDSHFSCSKSQNPCSENHFPSMKNHSSGSVSMRFRSFLPVFACFFHQNPIKLWQTTKLGWLSPKMQMSI